MSFSLKEKKEGMEEYSDRATRQQIHPLLQYDPQALDYIEVIRLEYFESDETKVRLSIQYYSYIQTLTKFQTHRHLFQEIKTYQVVQKRSSLDGLFWSRRLMRGFINLIPIRTV